MVGILAGTNDVEKKTLLKQIFRSEPSTIKDDLFCVVALSNKASTSLEFGDARHILSVGQ